MSVVASAVRTSARLAGRAAGRAVVVAAGFALTAGVSWGAQDVVLSRASRGPGLTIEGSISGVRAGAAAASVRLTLRNAGDAVRTVTRVTAVTTGVLHGPAACDGGYLTTRDWTGSVSVPARGTAVVTIPVAVSADLPPTCVDVTWGLAYTAF